MSITETARVFCDACETGKGWAECAQYCSPEATFSCQSQSLAETHSLEAYTEWMKCLLGPRPDGAGAGCPWVSAASAWRHGGSRDAATESWSRT